MLQVTFDFKLKFLHQDYSHFSLRKCEPMYMKLKEINLLHNDIQMWHTAMDSHVISVGLV